MSEQAEKNQGGVPPKVSPLTTAPAAGAPRPITVKLKPVAAAAPESDAATLATAQPSQQPAEAAATPEAADAAPAAPVRPVTVRLRPLATSGAAAPGAPRAPSSTQSITKIDAPTPKATSMLLPQQPAAAAPDGAAPGVAPRAPGSTQSIEKVDAPIPQMASPLQPQQPPTPGANPLPDGPKPLSPAQKHAAKSKTSRISLDSAIGVAPVGDEKGAPKTIRLKRPVALTPPAAAPGGAKSATSVMRQTSRIPDSALPTADAAADSAATVTQKKTLKIKRPGVQEPEAGVEGAEAFPEGLQMTPISPSDFAVHEEPSSVFTTLAAIAAIAAAVAIFATMWVLAAHAIGSVAGKNSTAFIKGPDLPCPGRMVN